MARFYAKDMGGKKEYDGVEFSIAGDSRDFSNDLYTLEAYQGKPTNQFIFTKPLMEAPHLDKKAYDKQQGCAATKKGRSTAMTKYEKLGDDEKKVKYMVVFPSDMQLTDIQYLESGEALDDKVIASLMVMGRVRIGVKDKNGEDVKSYAAINTWRLCDMSSEREIIGPDSKKRRGQKQAEDILAAGTDDSP